MERLKMRLGIVALGLITAITLSIFFSTPAIALTQGDYVVALTAKLGLGEGLTAEGAAAALKRVGIVPEGGWQLGLDVTCELVEEVQILTIKAAKRELIRYEAEDIPLLVASLSDELGVCAPPTVVVYPSVGVIPPPIHAPVVGETGVLSPSR